MVIADEGKKPERKQTDEKLKLERQRTDQALIDVKKSLEDHADIVIEHARENADAVLTEARDNADEKLADLGSDSAPSDTIVKKREIVIFNKKRKYSRKLFFAIKKNILPVRVGIYWNK